jgi:uncharacterized protein YgbK (DUF1537 family)
MRCLVTLDQVPDLFSVPGDLQVLVADTESRHLPPQEALERIRSIVDLTNHLGFDYIFKKTDSTLRGNLASELQGLMSAMPGVPVIFSPAYPLMGRTVRDATLFVNGIPVSQTHFGSDQLNPVRESSIPLLLAESRFPFAVRSIPFDASANASEPALYIADCATEEELHRTARDFITSGAARLAAGPAGFARHIAECLAQGDIKPPELPRIQRCLAINGSRHPISAQQISHALAHNWASYKTSLDPGQFGWAILDGCDFPASDAPSFPERFAEFACQALEQMSAEAAIVFGGDTAAAILKKAGVRHLEPLSEVLPGIPLARIHGAVEVPGKTSCLKRCFWITKAGGFGDIDLLYRIRELLEGVPQRCVDRPHPGR